MGLEWAGHAFTWTPPLGMGFLHVLVQHLCPLEFAQLPSVPSLGYAVVLWFCSFMMEKKHLGMKTAR